MTTAMVYDNHNGSLFITGKKKHLPLRDRKFLVLYLCVGFLKRIATPKGYNECFPWFWRMYKDVFVWEP